MRRTGLLITLLFLLSLAFGLSGCRREPKPTSEELAAQFRAQAESYLAERYPGLSISVRDVSATGGVPVVEASTLLLGQQCDFQVRVGKTRPASDSLSEQAGELFASQVWDELFERYDTGFTSITACVVRGKDELEFAVESEFVQLDVGVPFTLTLTPEGSSDDLLQQVRSKAMELARLHLERSYPAGYRARLVGDVSQSAEPPTVPASMEWLGETVDFEVKVCPSSVGDDLLYRISQMKWFSRATVWTYDEGHDCPGSAPLQAGKALSFFALQDNAVYVHGGVGSSGLLPLWYLTRNPEEIIPSHTPALYVMQEGAAVYSTPVEGAQTVSPPIEGQLVQVTAEYGDYSYGRFQTNADRSPVAGWIPTSELVPLSADNHPILVKTVLEQLEHLAPESLKPYALFQPSVTGKAYLDGSAARIKCQLSVFNQTIEFYVTYDGLYSDDLSASLACLTVYSRLPLAPLANGDRTGDGEFKPGQALRVLDLATGEHIGACAGANLPWVLVERGSSRGWLPFGYLSTDAADCFQVSQPYEMIVARETKAQLLHMDTHPVETLTPGKVVKVIGESDGYLYVRYLVGEAVPWIGGWVPESDLQAFDPALSKEGLLAKGAMLYENGPDSRCRRSDDDFNARVNLGEEKNGWIYIWAPGGMCGWTELKNVISRNPWRVP